ncbi:MAG: hypothetical protein ABMA64_13245 [Myxococcota bacterium]
MRTGERWADRWELLEALPTRDGMERWRAVAVDTGEPVEILRPTPSVDAASRASFVDLHHTLSRVSDPALARTYDVRSLEGRPYAVRAALEVPTLADLRLPLDSATVAWVGATLAPAVLAAGPATRGALRAVDVGIDAGGRPVLAPRIDPLTRVALGSTRCVAPESFAGSAADGAAGLYGLGVVLYELVTGREPTLAGAPGRRAPPPPPSSLRHGIPPALDLAIARLMSDDPGQRIGAVPVLQQLAGPPVDLRPTVRAPVVGPPRATQPNPSRAAREDSDPGGIVVLPPAALREMSPSERSVVAGHARVPLSVLEQLQRRGLPVVIETTAGASAARSRAKAIRSATGLPVVATAPGGVAAGLWLAVGLMASAVPAVVGLVLLLFGLLPYAALSFALTVALWVAGWLGGRSGAAGWYRPGLAALAVAREVTAEGAAEGPLAPAWARLGALRLEVAGADLPPAVSTDVRDALKEVEDELEALAQVAGAAARTLRQVDLPALRTRLASLSARASSDRSALEERDRVARTVADLEAIDAQARSVGIENGRILDRLGEISAALAVVGPDPSDEGLRRLGDTARRARDASIEGELRHRSAARGRGLEIG